MTLFRRLPFFLLLLSAALAIAFATPRPARAACTTNAGGATPCPTNAVGASTQVPRPTATAGEAAKPQSGNDTFKLASLGIVFLVIGAAVVYAPQIVSAISGLPRLVFGSSRKTSGKRSPTPEAESTGELPTPRAREPEPPSVYASPPVRSERPIESSEPNDVVTRLQSEVRSAWTKSR